MIEIMLAVGSQAEAVAMALIRWYFQWAGAMGRVISARWLSLPRREQEKGGGAEVCLFDLCGYLSEKP